MSKRGGKRRKRGGKKEGKRKEERKKRKILKEKELEGRNRYDLPLKRRSYIFGSCC